MKEMNTLCKDYIHIHAFHYYRKQMPNYSRFLPIANINRIMKKALPDNAKIAKDAKETV